MEKSTNENDKQNIITGLRVHKLKAKAFYNLLGSTEAECIKISFDCQKNLALPKLPDQAAYFSQQINFYNLTLVVGNSKTDLNENNVLSYVWLETKANKNSNAIASAVHGALKKCFFLKLFQK